MITLVSQMGYSYNIMKVHPHKRQNFDLPLKEA